MHDYAFKVKLMLLFGFKSSIYSRHSCSDGFACLSNWTEAGRLFSDDKVKHYSTGQYLSGKSLLLALTHLYAYMNRRSHALLQRVFFHTFSHPSWVVAVTPFKAAPVWTHSTPESSKGGCWPVGQPLWWLSSQEQQLWGRCKAMAQRGCCSHLLNLSPMTFLAAVFLDGSLISRGEWSRTPWSAPFSPCHSASPEGVDGEAKKKFIRVNFAA